MKTNHVSDETSSIVSFIPNMFCFHQKLKKKKINFKSIMWFIKAISYFVLLQRLNNNNNNNNNDNNNNNNK